MMGRLSKQSVSFITTLTGWESPSTNPYNQIKEDTPLGRDDSALIGESDLPKKKSIFIDSGMSSSRCPATLTEDPSTWVGQSLVSVTQLTPKGFGLLVDISKQMRDLVKRQGGDDRLKHKVLATVFYEASTRTSCSFQAAMMRLGGKFLHVDGQGNSSAAKKKESLEDTIRCLECYVDVVVMRHPATGSVPEIAKVSTKPTLNAGDGVN